jgi:hypothetical protein
VPPPVGPCFGLAQRAEVAAQALKGRRVGPALGTIDRASGRARSCFFGSCLVPLIVPGPFGNLYPHPSVGG